MLKFFIFLIYLYPVWKDAVGILIIAYGASWSLTIGQGKTSVMRIFSVLKLLTMWSIVLTFWQVGFLRVVLSYTCQVLLCMFQVELLACCSQYLYLQQLGWFSSELLLLLLKVLYLAFKSILVFLCLQGKFGRKHLQDSFCFCSSLDTLFTHVW